MFFFTPVLRARTTWAFALAALAVTLGAPADGQERAVDPSHEAISQSGPRSDPSSPGRSPRNGDPLARRLPSRNGTPPQSPAARQMPSAGSAIFGLAVVVGLILGVARIWKKHGVVAGGATGNDAIELLSRRRIESRQSISLVRVGSKILVLGSSSGELSALSEITDPIEVDFLTSRCREAGASTPFAKLFASRTSAGDSVETPAATAPHPEAFGSPSSPTPARLSPEERLSHRLRARVEGEPRHAA